MHSIDHDDSKNRWQLFYYICNGLNAALVSMNNFLQKQCQKILPATFEQ